MSPRLLCVCLYYCLYAGRFGNDLVVVAERDVAPWQERSLMVRWVVGSILHGGHIEIFLVPASAPRLV